jgi:RNA polymerase sigma-70 factor (ECF subfamily)
MNDRKPSRASRAESQWAEWMAAAQAGDSATYERLLISIVPELRAFVRARLRDPSAAEDVVQNVLLSIHRARHKSVSAARFPSIRWRSPRTLRSRGTILHCLRA